jgi:hypothetical protein
VHGRFELSPLGDLNDRARRSADPFLQKPRLLAAWVTVVRWFAHADLLALE